MTMELQDKIGRQVFVDKVCGLVDTLQEGKNFCLSINGAWGSGKSFVLQMIENQLLKKEEYLIIKYDAWENNFYPDPLIAILYCILDTLKNKFHLLNDTKNYQKAIKQSFKDRTNKKLSEIIENLYKVGKWGAVCAFTIEIIKSVIVQAKSSILDNKLFDDYKSYQALLADSISVLNALTTFKEHESKQTKLIVLVDEIDRCLPNEQLIVLERLHHLFKVKNCAVVVALNREAIYKNFDANYGGNGKEYLRKFFDYSFNLSMSNSIFCRNYIWDNIIENKELNFVTSISQKDIGFLQDFIFSQIESAFGSKDFIDNRSVERILKNILDIVFSISECTVDFAYMILISYLVCCNLYNTKRFNSIKNKQEDYPIDIFSKSRLNSEYLGVYTTRRFVKGTTLNIYYFNPVNTVNYYLSLWLALDNSSNEVENIKKFFYDKIVVGSDFVKKLELIFDSVDRIAEDT